MAEIPEHLLRRSKERRAALSGETATEEATAATTEAPPAGAPVRASAPPTEAGSGGGGAPTTGFPAVADQPEAPRGPRRTLPKIPIWVMPVLVALPLWGIIYLGAFGSRNVSNNDPVTIGGNVFNENCSTCHGANGQGGVGPQLNGGEVIREWPNIQDHINWVHTGGAPYVGGTIGALHIPVTPSNVMPAFGMDHGGTLTNLQIQQVVCYERVEFGGETESATNCPGFTG